MPGKKLTKADIEYRFCRPSGSPILEPSGSVEGALKALTSTDEVQALAADARERGRKLVVQVFNSSAGVPFLIHLTTVRV